MIDAFSSHVIHARMGTAHTGEGIKVMTQALHAGDGSLPQGLTLQNTYTEFGTGSKNVTAVVRNSTAYPQTLRKKSPVARLVLAIQVPEPPIRTGVIEALEEAQSLQMPRLTMKQRQEKLVKELDKLGDSAWVLLAECHDVFSLEPSKLGCTHSTEHVIKVTNNTSFKE